MIILRQREFTTARHMIYNAEKQISNNGNIKKYIARKCKGNPSKVDSAISDIRSKLVYEQFAREEYLKQKAKEMGHEIRPLSKEQRRALRKLEKRKLDEYANRFSEII